MTAKSSEGIPEKKTSNETELKKPRIERPSPFPAVFKVRKEKIGDRITALQQLVSPFGKTATASVLHDTIEYIKFLHEQVLCTPYLRNLRPTQQEKKSEKSMDEEESTQDLRSRGLCLVPLTSTYSMASDGSDHF
ncbi:transcription factor bHLH103 isoform X2 [Dendrobium catenatum]|uniref:transcription factor bHLH103 isoform X2 n=1 Tax=Dendrobium catenatum TaxID=906689 RepID=UPI0009F25024|nr:transcription factor bHLH103 isoform X2 [Dendrobium catenatum]